MKALANALRAFAGASHLKGAKIQFHHGSGANPELSVRIAQTRLRVPELQQQ
jgi:hypothetical protein